MSDGKVNEGVDDKDASMTSQHSSEDLFAEEYNTIDPNVTRYFLKILLCKSFSMCSIYMYSRRGTKVKDILP